ncbi:PucR family transcriptional regulator [Nocardia bhagyanarayanae]|uniref:PucR-like helix-turn-helix protein n=1 Tax=Nocardia bhagyanarayanae TaxID=1215925 RepID=A0A543FD13_9NOCA|nr:helix-turn-helix domain-containing protein [Nocardia bhagyanarayanae]TQM31631.1 PucR-like helix-turn-helix protein [Nocardia bhagyanarayanae]
MCEYSLESDSARPPAPAADVASVLRIVRYFDSFDESGADADAVIRAAARLGDCVVGARWPSGRVVRYDAAGRPVPGTSDGAEITVGAEISVGADVSGGAQPTVWVERREGDRRLDGVLLDRLRHSLRVVAARRSPPDTLHLGDRGLLEVVLSDKEHRADRARALYLLGVDATRAVRVLAISGPSAREAVRIVADRVSLCCSAALGDTTAVLIQGCPDSRTFSDALNTAITQAFPVSRGGGTGPWVGIGELNPAVAAAVSWDQARRALRFASSTWQGRRAVAFDRLGSLELLADLPVDRLLGNADVLRINAFAATEAGALAVDTLEAFCVFGSLRRTAGELHIHHSTVAARIAQVEGVMGWDIDDALDRFQATLVLTVRRMALSATELAERDR